MADTPTGLKAAGRRLWLSIADEYELDEHELVLLREIVRTVDAPADLEVLIRSEGVVVTGPQGTKSHPALVEARQQRIALARLQAALRLPAGAEETARTDARPPAARRCPWPVRHGRARGRLMKRRTAEQPSMEFPSWVLAFDRTAGWGDDLPVLADIWRDGQSQAAQNLGAVTAEGYVALWQRHRAKEVWRRAAEAGCFEHGLPASIPGTGPRWAEHLT